MLSKLRLEWKAIHPNARVSCLTSIVAGVVLFVVFVPSDLVGFWNSHPYLGNLASNVTGALFGIPIAVLLLSRVSARQGEAIERRGTLRLAVRSTEDLYTRGQHFLAPVSLTRTQNGTSEVTRFNHRGFEEVNDYLMAERAFIASKVTDNYDPEELIDVASEESLKLLVTALEKREGLAFYLYGALRFNENLVPQDSWWAELRSTWETIYRDIKHQFMKLGIDWPLTAKGEAAVRDIFALELDLRTVFEIANEAYNMPDRSALACIRKSCKGKDLNVVVRRVRDHQAQDALDEMLLATELVCMLEAVWRAFASRFADKATISGALENKHWRTLDEFRKSQPSIGEAVRRQKYRAMTSSALLKTWKRQDQDDDVSYW